MNNNFTIDLAIKSESLNSKSIKRLYKQNVMLNFLYIETINPRMTQKQMSKQLGFSDGTIKRNGDDIQMDSVYIRNNYKERTPEQKPSTTTNENSKHITNRRSKSVSKIGSIHDFEHEKTNYFTLAGNVVDII